MRELGHSLNTTYLVVAHLRMFSKIPQKFSAPFGLLGDEAKLAFPSQANGIAKLFTVRVCVEFLCDLNMSLNTTPFSEYTSSGHILGAGTLDQETLPS